MVEFARYYIQFISDFFSDIWDVISGIGKSIANIFFFNLRDHVVYFIEASRKFEILDWICFIVVIFINVAFLVFLGLRLFQLLRRHIKFRKREVEKEDLLEEISALNYKIEELVEEKNQIFAMKVSNLGLKPSRLKEERDALAAPAKSKAPVKDSRFVKLIAVDAAYDSQITAVTMAPDDMLDLPGLIERFVNFSASQLRLFYEKKTIAYFFAGMATSKILILEGISGTGKTSLPYAMGKFFRNDTSIISVQPSWRDRAEIIGYLNEFTKKFNETDFLKSLYETTYREDLNFIILDEMNLARIEYYFAEFLSIMEMPDRSEWKIDIVPEALPEDPKNLINGKILVPQNVWFIGTANKDDSTFTITDKVYDRATSIEMNHKATFIDAPYTPSITVSYEYLDSLFLAAGEKFALGTKTLDNLAKLDRFIADTFKITFGNRILKQIKLFVPVFVACGFTENEGLDNIIVRKVLRKFESLNLSFLHKEMDELVVFLDKLYGKNTFKECISYIRDLQRSS